MSMTTEQALNNLYNAARLAAQNVEQDELSRKCAEQLAEALEPKPEPAAQD